VTLEIPAGYVVALVGPSGAGKSTLCDVIARFHDPTEGLVELDGIDIRKIDLQCYRRLIAVVEQDIFLFEGTIRENLAYGARDASPAAIAQAAEAALAARFIEEMDEGYETLVGERGVRLSGGQRKRLAIARALLTDPRILILDEATSELDAASERLVHRSLATLMRGRTVFVIAHRLSTVAHADLIVLLDRGRVVDQGRHSELLGRSAPYRALVEAQLLDLDRPVSVPRPT
jgi:ATP-binding cassette subfamily B protein/subfamily B ATP-binding cassette protein MsbA